MVSQGLTSQTTLIELLNAVADLSLDCVRTLLDADGDLVNQRLDVDAVALQWTDRHCENMTALKLAARLGHSAIVSELLDRGASDPVNEPLLNPIRYGVSALYMAAEEGHLHIVNMLKECTHYKASISSAVLAAITHDKPRAIECLLKCDNDVVRTAQTELGYDGTLYGLLSYAMDCTWSAMHMVRLLYVNGADIDARDGDSAMTPLLCSIATRDLDTFYYLLRQGADIDKPRLDEKPHPQFPNTAWDWAWQAEFEDSYRYNACTPVYRMLLEAVVDAGGWCLYVAGLRMPYILIRDTVQKGQLDMVPSNDEASNDEELCQFVFAQTPDGVFVKIASYLGDRLVDESRRWDEDDESTLSSET